MQNRGLLFIPDISGFTRFVTETEIDHSRQIIKELLEVLINANEIGLEISEIEGDAILFYRFGEPPSIQDVYRQVEKMFCAFHSNLTSYDHRRYCLCKACSSASHLTLKVITHYGEFTGYNVHSFNKLIGKDVIVAHQLLKNDIDTHEYWLVTHTLAANVGDLVRSDNTPWLSWQTSSKQTDTGDIPYSFTLLSPLKERVAADPLPPLDLSHKMKVISLSREYDTDFITLFHACGDFTYRSQWRDGVKNVTMIDHHLPRVGMRCKTEMENGEVFIHASSYCHSPERLQFSETNESDKSVTRYTIDILGEKRSSLTLDYYISKGIAADVLFNIFRRKKMQDSFERSLINLDKLANTLVIPA